MTEHVEVLRRLAEAISACKSHKIGSDESAAATCNMIQRAINSPDSISALLSELEALRAVESLAMNIDSDGIMDDEEDYQALQAAFDRLREIRNPKKAPQ